MTKKNGIFVPPEALVTSDDDSGSSDDSDEFDSTDDRVNQIFPSQSFGQEQDEGSDYEDSGESPGTRLLNSTTAIQESPILHKNRNSDSSKLEEEKEASDDYDASGNENEEDEDDNAAAADDDDDDGSSSSGSEPILSQLSKGSFSYNRNAVQKQEFKDIEKKARVEHAKRSLVEDTKRALVEDAKKASMEGAKRAPAEKKEKKAKVEDAKKVQVEGAKKTQLEDAKKLEMDSGKKRKVEDGYSVKKSKEGDFELQDKESNCRPISRKESWGGKNGKEYNEHSEKLHKGDESDSQLSMRKNESSFGKLGLKHDHDDEVGVKRSSSKKRRKESPSNNVEQTHKKQKEIRENIIEHHDAGNEIIRKTRDDSATQANGTISSKRSLKADDKGLEEIKGNASLKPKKPHLWTLDEEIFLASEIINYMKLGSEIPTKRSDQFWVNLAKAINDKFNLEFTVEQVSEKIRRLKSRYRTMIQKVKNCKDSEEPYKHKTLDDQKLFDMLIRIWGRSEIKEDFDPLVSVQDKHAQDMVNAENLSNSQPKKGEETSKLTVVAGQCQKDRDPNQAQDLVNSENLSTLQPKKAEATPKPAIVLEHIQKDCDPKHALDTPVTLKSQPNKALSTSRKADRDIKPLSPTPVQENSSSPSVCGFDFLSMQKFLREEIQTYVNELVDLSKQRLEDFANTTKLKIERSIQEIGENSRNMIELELESMVVPSLQGICLKSMGTMDSLQTFGEDDALRKKWHEIQRQELDIYGRKLKITRDECDLKQKKLEFYLQLKRGEDG